jgi:hypothetical protein
VVDPTVGGDFKILSRAAIRRFRVIEAVRHAHPFDLLKAACLILDRLDPKPSRIGPITPAEVLEQDAEAKRQAEFSKELSTGTKVEAPD